MLAAIFLHEDRNPPPGGGAGGSQVLTTERAEAQIREQSQSSPSPIAFSREIPAQDSPQHKMAAGDQSIKKQHSGLTTATDAPPRCFTTSTRSFASTQGMAGASARKT